MASERLQVILDLETGRYRTQARGAASSTREIGDTAETTQKSLGKMQERFKGIGIAAAAGLGAATLAFVGSSVKAASDLGESINAVEQTFESASDTCLLYTSDAADDL